MALYAIGDLHLSLGTDKPMDVFGASWEGYVDKIKKGFDFLNDDDVTVLCGDISWGMSLEESLPDFRFIDALPGTKIVLKGNHDYWWATAAKLSVYFEKNGISTIRILNNNAYIYGDIAVCGTRGWFFEEETGSAHDKKILSREVMRLEASLKAAGSTDRKICFLHYPPVYKNYICLDIVDMLKKYGVTDCWYGHIHSHGLRHAVTGLNDGVEYHMVSADYVGFTPVRVY